MCCSCRWCYSVISPASVSCLFPLGSLPGTVPPRRESTARQAYLAPLTAPVPSDPICLSALGASQFPCPSRNHINHRTAAFSSMDLVFMQSVQCNQPKFPTLLRAEHPEQAQHEGTSSPHFRLFELLSPRLYPSPFSPLSLILSSPTCSTCLLAHNRLVIFVAPSQWARQNPPHLLQCHFQKTVSEWLSRRLSIPLHYL